jgi:hypothetical protein
MHGGRPPGEPPPDYAARWIQCLIDRRDGALRRKRTAEDELYLAVAELLERENVSLRSLGEALGVPSKTLHEWAKRGRILTGQDDDSGGPEAPG